jgi:hypothetical protein
MAANPAETRTRRFWRTKEILESVENRCVDNINGGFRVSK